MSTETEFINDFKLVGLSKPGSFTLALLSNEDEHFWAVSELQPDRFNALFDYCKHHWEDKKIAEVRHSGLNEEGFPKNPIVINIKEK